MEYVYKTKPSDVHTVTVKLDSGDTVTVPVGIYRYAYKPSRHSDTGKQWEQHVAPAERASERSQQPAPAYGVVYEEGRGFYPGQPVYTTGSAGVIDDIAFAQRAGVIQ